MTIAEAKAEIIATLSAGPIRLPPMNGDYVRLLALAGLMAEGKVVRYHMAMYRLAVPDDDSIADMSIEHYSLFKIACQILADDDVTTIRNPT